MRCGALFTLCRWFCFKLWCCCFCCVAASSCFKLWLTFYALSLILLQVVVLLLLLCCCFKLLQVASSCGSLFTLCRWFCFKFHPPDLRIRVVIIICSCLAVSRVQYLSRSNLIPFLLVLPCNSCVVEIATRTCINFVVEKGNKKTLCF